MKVLFIGSAPEENANIQRMTGNQYPKLELVAIANISSLSELMMNDGPFAFVIMSIDNKNIDAGEVYKTIHEVLGERPFVFIGSPNAIKSQLTSDMLQIQYCNNFVETPFNVEEFKKAVDPAIAWVKKEEFNQSILELSRDDLHRMRIRNFYLFDQLPYDVYLELTSTKFGKIISENKFYTHQLIQNYTKKNIKYLYLKKDDHLKFLEASIKHLIKNYSLKISERKKYVALHLKTAFFIHQFIKTVNVSDEVNELAHLFIESVSDVVRSFENLSDILDTVYDSNSMTFAEQSVATAYVCECILLKLGWSADMTRGKLILAALLQDIGLSNDDLILVRSLNDPTLKTFSEEDQIEFRNHPTKAALISTFFNGFSDVDFILNEQHEHPTGDGFPNGISSSGITTISCVFIIANNFISRIAEKPKTPERYRELITGMKRVYYTGNFKDPMKALEKALKK